MPQPSAGADGREASQSRAVERRATVRYPSSLLSSLHAVAVKKEDVGQINGRLARQLKKSEVDFDAQNGARLLGEPGGQAAGPSAHFDDNIVFAKLGGF